MKVLETRSVALGDLKPYPGNPRQHDVPTIKRSLERNGQYRTIVVQKKGMRILAGHGTVEAASELGWPEIRCEVIDCTPAEAKRIVLVDNRSNDLAGYDEAALAELLGSLQERDGSGYSDDDLQRLLQRVNDHNVDTSADARPDKPRTMQGEVIDLGPHRLLCGDSTDTDNVERLMNGAAAQMVLADPPYNVGYGGGGTRRRADAYEDSRDDYGPWLAAALRAGASASDAKAALHLWYAGALGATVYAAVSSGGWQARGEPIIWDKCSIKGGLKQSTKHYRTQYESMLYCHKSGKSPRWFGPNNESTIWALGPRRANPLHPTTKPTDLYERSLLNHTQIGDAVLELFAGSGTTLIAAENLGRRCFCMEIDPGYCDVIVDRWERHTGKKATREHGAA